MWEEKLLTWYVHIFNPLSRSHIHHIYCCTLRVNFFKLYIVHILEQKLTQFKVAQPCRGFRALSFG